MTQTEQVRELTWLCSAALAVASMTGCALEAKSHVPAEEVETTSHELIAGFAANTAALDAVGALTVMYVDPFTGETRFDLICSAALIDADTVLTAKHCIESIAFVGEPYTAVFTVGPNSANPSQWVDIAETERAPGDTGGFTGYGHDVGIVQLVREVAGVTPLAIAGLDDSHVGRNFVAIGYGVRNNAGQLGLRRMGKVQLRAREGRTWEVLLGSFEAFFEWYTGSAVPTDCDSEAPADPYLCETLAYLRSIYESTVLEATDEAIAGGAPGDAQPCLGDSGSPLMLATGRGLTAFGVVNGSVGSDALICDHGAVYASFGAEVLEFLEAAKGWVDPCGGLSTSGVCEGTVARRCTTRVEGPRRIVEFDCADVGLTCEPQAAGLVGCGEDDQSFAPPASREPRSGEAPPDLLDLEERVFIDPGEPIPPH